MSAVVRSFEHSLALPFFGTGMKTDLFQSCGHCWVFQIFWHIECSTFTASSFRIWNSSTGIPSPQLAVFVVMLSKAHLTSHSRMSGSRWVITPLWLSGLWRSNYTNKKVLHDPVTSPASPNPTLWFRLPSSSPPSMLLPQRLCVHCSSLASLHPRHSWLSSSLP